MPAPTDDEANNAQRRSRRTTALLVAGVVVGAVVAALGLSPSGVGVSALPSDCVARVNDQPIRLQDFDRMLAALSRDRREPPTEQDRQHLLDRLIDEELLVQRGLELGFARKDRRVRAEITASMIASIVAEVDGIRASERDLQEFYEERRDFFVRPGRLRVRQIFFRVPNPESEPAVREQAQQAALRLRDGEDFEVVAAQLGDESAVALPDDLLPATKLRDYLGPTALRSVLGLSVGEVSNPVRSGSGVHVLQLVNRQDDFAPPLDSIRPEVEREFRRRAEDDALRNYLDRLRKRAEVTTKPVLP